MNASALSLQLRTNTAAAHEALETGLDLLRADLTRADYVQLLHAFNGYLTPWFERVTAYLPDDVDTLIDGRRHLTRLDADLHRLDRGAPSARCAALPAIDDYASALGSSYVIEGSMLGARVVGPELQRRFGLTADDGCAYFSGDGAATGKRWSQFRALLDSLRADQQPAAVAAANQTFETLLDWFRSRRVARGPAPGMSKG